VTVWLPTHFESENPTGQLISIIIIMQFPCGVMNVHQLISAHFLHRRSQSGSACVVFKSITVTFSIRMCAPLDILVSKMVLLDRCCGHYIVFFVTVQKVSRSSGSLVITTVVHKTLIIMEMHVAIVQMSPRHSSNHYLT